jgi:hypothetical protein
MKSMMRVAVLIALAALAPVACSTSGGDAEAMSAQDFVCNQVMGVSVTGDWFTAGFESALDDGRWQVVSQSHAYIDLWADPANAVWSIAPVSACALNADNPDRVLFTGCNWTYTTVGEWTTAFTAVVEDLKAKYPGLKRIDLMTMLRGPGNKVCDFVLGEGAEPIPGSTEVVVEPWIDEAIANVVAAYPGFVTAAPAFYAPTCDVFSFGGPHFSEGGDALVAKVFSDYYSTEP